MKFQVFKDEDGQWRWHLKARNGRLIACGGEGFKRRNDCITSIQKVASNASTAFVPAKHVR